jgi:hypothetical protein
MTVLHFWPLFALWFGPFVPIVLAAVFGPVVDAVRAQTDA